jgi:hypothetical protein
MVARWVGAIAEFRVVEQERECGQRTIQPRIADLPILAGQDLLDVLRGRRMDAGVFENDLVVIEQERRVERIRVSCKGAADYYRQQQGMFRRRAHRQGR